MSHRLPTLVAAMAVLLLASIAVWWSPLNQDEGWYLMAAQRVAEGDVPYRDFAFTQPPVFPAVYQFGIPLIESLGLLGGRLMTLGFALASGLLLTLTLRQSLSEKIFPLAGLLLLCLLGLNPAYLQFSTTVKTYALAGFFLCAAIHFYLRSTQHTSPLSCFLCGMCCAFAAGTRLSLVVFALPMGFDLLRRRRETGIAPAFWFSTGGSLTLFALFVPFLFFCPEEFGFGIWQFHHGRLVDHAWLLRGAFLLRFIRNAFPMAGLFLFLWLTRTPITSTSKTLLWGAGLVSLIHVLAPFPYEEYQTVLFPVFALVLASEVPTSFPKTLSPRIPVLVVLVGLLFAGSSPHLESWFSGTRDRLWWPVKPHSELSTLRKAAQTIHELDPEGDLLLTTDTYLAIEAGKDVPRGMEMGPFCYFPTLTPAQADHFHVLNEQRLIELLRTTEAPVAALSGYGFTIQSPQLTPTNPGQLARIEQALRLYYFPAGQQTPFGQEGTTLRFFLR